MFVKRCLAGALVALFILSTGGKVLAAPITGTLEFVVVNPFMNATGTFVSADDTLSVLLTAIGDFGAIPDETSFGAFTLDASDPVGTFGLSNAGYGTFVPTSALIFPPPTEFLLSVLLSGVFTPGIALPGLDPSLAIVELIFDRVGGEGDVPVTTLRLTALGVAPPGVPEPAVWTLLAIGGLALARRRRANAG